MTTVDTYLKTAGAVLPALALLTVSRSLSARAWKKVANSWREECRKANDNNDELVKTNRKLLELNRRLLNTNDLRQ